MCNVKLKLIGTIGDCVIRGFWEASTPRQKMSQFGITDVNLSTGSDDFTEENWFSSPTTSFDGSSVNSIPWAEDVVKQNREEWERIERMFYGEENLPSDVKLRNEIIEWTSRFPHIRVCGQQAPIFFDTSMAPLNANYEEIIETHSSTPTRSAPKSVRIQGGLEQVLEDSLHIDLGHRLRTSDGREHDRNHYIENAVGKCLRITSGAILSKRSANHDIPHHKDIRTSARIASTASSQNRIARTTLKPIAAEIRCIRIGKESFDDLISNRIILEPIHITKSEPLSLSARLVKMPDIPSEIDWHKIDKTKNSALSHNKIRVTTASVIPARRPLRSSITLPAINLMPSMFAESPGRSISAVHHQNNKRSATHVPLKSATKLRSET